MRPIDLEVSGRYETGKQKVGLGLASSTRAFTKDDTPNGIAGSTGTSLMERPNKHTRTNKKQGKLLMQQVQGKIPAAAPGKAIAVGSAGNTTAVLTFMYKRPR